MQQLCEAGEAEFLEIMDLVGMASKPMHVRRLQKALQEWVQNPGKLINFTHFLSYNDIWTHSSAKSQKTRVAVVKLSIQFSYGDFYDMIVARLHKSRDKGEMEKKVDIAWLQV